jgi:peptidoglycan hydrolase CwlO-like protein
MLWSIAMDEASLMNLLTTAPPMAAFAMYLVYQNKGNVQRFDSLMEKQDVREKDLRSRYDKVISDLQQEKMDFKDDANAVRTTLSTKIEGINKQIDEMEKKFDRLLNVVDKIQEKLTELRIKDIARGNE